MEVIVVNDGGPDLEECLEPFRSEMGLQLHQQSNAGPARARNQGARLARGQRLVFLDDDCLPMPDWHQCLRATALEHPEALIGGRTINGLRGNVYAATSQLLVDFLYEYYARDGGRPGRFFTSNNLSVPSESFLEVGGFDESFSQAAGEDREFCDRWIGSQREVHYDPRICISHAHAMGLSGFVRQHLAYGQAARRYWELRLARSGAGRSLEPLSFYGELLSYAWKNQGPGWGAAQQTWLLLLAQLSNALGYYVGVTPKKRNTRGCRPSNCC